MWVKIVMISDIVCVITSILSIVSVCRSFLYCPLGGVPFLGKPLPLAGPFALAHCSCG